MNDQEWDGKFFAEFERKHGFPAQSLGLTESELSAMRDMTPEKAAATFTINLDLGDN